MATTTVTPIKWAETSALSLILWRPTNGPSNPRHTRVMRQTLMVSTPTATVVETAGLTPPLSSPTMLMAQAARSQSTQPWNSTSKSDFKMTENSKLR